MTRINVLKRKREFPALNIEHRMLFVPLWNLWPNVFYTCDSFDHQRGRHLECRWENFNIKF